MRPPEPGDARHRPALTVTTVLYNSAGSLQQYAEALAPAVASGVISVIVIDNASPDDSATQLPRLLPSATLISNASNLGFAAACNRAWPEVATRYWLLLNPDVVADPDGIRRLVRWMDENPDVGVASPTLCQKDGRDMAVARPDDSLWRPVIEALRLHKLLPDRVRSRWLLSGHAIPSDRIRGWVPGAAMIARREAVETVGLLNDRLFMYGEDREWCGRMRRAGWSVGVCRDVQFVHDQGTSAERTWGSEEQARREVEGHLRVTLLTHGHFWTRVFALVTGMALTAESIDRRRGPAVRAECRRRGRLYLASVMNTGRG
jgi:GT2 family glycosyltransferase